MWKELIYGNNIYSQFLINENGQIQNIKTNKIYKYHYSTTGKYPVISLPMGKRGSVKPIRLHKALAETFIVNPDPENFNIVHHKDSNKKNFSLDNLEWTNTKGNTYYSQLEQCIKNGPYFNNRKLTKSDIEFINAYKYFYTDKELGWILDTSKVTVYNVRHGKSYYNNIW